MKKDSLLESIFGSNLQPSATPPFDFHLSFRTIDLLLLENELLLSNNWAHMRRVSIVIQWRWQFQQHSWSDLWTKKDVARTSQGENKPYLYISHPAGMQRGNPPEWRRKAPLESEKND